MEKQSNTADVKKLNADKPKVPEELSEEDNALKNDLEMLLERLEESDVSLYLLSLEQMRTFIRSATTSMTSVPKPLKFLRPHYAKIKSLYDKMHDDKSRRLCADIVSILGMTMTDDTDTKLDTLMFRFLGTQEEIGAWGHEYVRHLTTQLVSLWEDNDFGLLEKTSISSVDTNDLEAVKKFEQMQNCVKLINDIIPYHMAHNAEAEAIDMCLELEKLGLLLQYTDKRNYQRVCLYLLSCVPYLPEPDNSNALQCCIDMYALMHDWGNAVRCALHSPNSGELVQKLFRQIPTSESSAKLEIHLQLAALLGRHQNIESVMQITSEFETVGDEIQELLFNSKASDHFILLARELDIMEPKLPEDVYKSHLEPIKSTLGGGAVDSARANLAASYVNGLLNCGFGQDKLLMDDREMAWIYKNKESGMMSTVATLGWIMLWDVDVGLTKIDKYLYSDVEYVKAGGLLACGVVASGVRNECDPALAILSDSLEEKANANSRKAAIVGLGVAYAGTGNKEALEKLLPIVMTVDVAKFDQAALAALSCGMITVGTLDDSVTATILASMIDRAAGKGQFDTPMAKLMALGLALPCMCAQEGVEVVLATLKTVAEPMRSMAAMLCDICAYAGTGNVLKVQHLLHILSEKYEEKKEEKEKSDATAATDKSGKTTSDASKKDTKTAEAMEVDESVAPKTEDDDAKSGDASAQGDSFKYTQHQGIAALGLAVIAIGEDIGSEMSFRMFGNLLRFGEVPIKRAIPLALALTYMSNPQLKVLDTLSKFSHDSDAELAHSAILAMGFVGAGTNNARLAAMLRQLAMYHARDASNLFMVRLAQGLAHLGKGTLTLNPMHSDRFLLCKSSLAGLLTVLILCLDMKKTLLSKYDFLLFYLTPAIHMRMLFTVDEDLKQLPVVVRIGQAVDVVGQAGCPKSITGFQTHTTPVLLAHGERAELATEEYLPVTKLPLEGLIILKKNPDYEANTVA